MEPERAATADEESLEEVYEHAPCGYLSAAAHDGVIVKLNATLLSWTGHAREQLLEQRRFVDLLATGSRIYYETHVAPLLRMQGAVQSIALDVVCKDGRRLPVFAHAQLKRDAHGRESVIRITLFDATERRAYERELLAERRRADEAALAKARFVSVLSHEIRNPLTVIFNAASLLERSGVSPDQQRAIVMLNAASRELAELVGNVLDLNRIEAGKLPLQEHPFLLSEWLYKIAEQARSRAETKGLGFELTLDPRIPRHLAGDHVKIRQVLTNLLGNAVKFTPLGRVALNIELLSLFGDAARLRFSVTDTGVGIAPERIGRLGEDFTQGSYDITANYGGSGLGLAICKRLLALYGSELTITSSPGEGSEFGFELTLRSCVDAPTGDGRVSAGLQGMNVLIVDAHHVDALAASALLGSWGLRVNAVTDITQAIAMVRAQRYDAILMDRRVGGDSAARLLRAATQPPGTEVRMIALMPAGRAVEAGSLNVAGFDDALAKPVSSEALLRALARHGRRVH